jgi:hypothetical protein
MRQEVLDKKRAPAVIGRIPHTHDKTIRVAADVEHQAASNLVRGRIGDTNVMQVVPLSRLGDLPPILQPISRIRVRLLRTTNSGSAYDVHVVLRIQR